MSPDHPLLLLPQAVSRALLEWGGYLMELSDGLCLASFADPGAAVGWALDAQADLMEQVRGGPETKLQ